MCFVALEKLEEMNPQETAKSYDALAAHWDSEDFNRKNGLGQHAKAVRFSRKSGHAIEVGCGSSGRIIDFLLSSGFEVEGLDISTEMLNLARSKHPDLQFHQADIVTWEFPIPYDFISAWDSVWHVPLEHQSAVLEKLCGGLTDGGILIYTTGGVDSPEQGTNAFKSQPLYHAALGIPKVIEALTQAGCICRHLEYDQARGDDPGKHVYLIIQKVSHVSEGL